MAHQKPNVSLRPVVEAIEKLLQELDEVPVEDGERGQRRRALRATLEGTALLLQAECWSSAANEAVYEFPSA